MFENMIASLKVRRRKLVFTEGSDARILEAASRLYQEGILTPILLGKPCAIERAAKEGGWSIAGIEIIEPFRSADYPKLVDKLVKLRKGKIGYSEARLALAKPNYFGTMLVKMGYADALLGGATYSTAETVRPALQIIKTKPGHKIVSSCFILHRSGEKGEEIYVMADCAINIAPNEDELAEIAVETAGTARVFAIEPKIAMLSYSTLGSGRGSTVDLMHNATEKLKAMNLDFPVDGELQFDAAVSPAVAEIKAAGSQVAGRANTFIFPDINAANIGYKIAQRLGGFEAIGPILQGLNAPVNDLSRGCNGAEVYKLAIITAALN